MFLFVLSITGILSHEEDDSDSDTGISSRFDSSTEIIEHCENEKEEKQKVSTSWVNKKIHDKKDIIQDIERKELYVFLPLK